jgi:insulysin
MDRRFSLLAGCLALFLAPAAFARDLAELPPPERAPADQSEYRRFTLDNGLKVILVSDPKFNKSGAALVVSIGQIDDPAEREGMAHFLEHMLFLGTAKYPDAGEYGQFIQANGGYSNAYTSLDHTNYHFEVRHEAFPEALDRFAQFFIGPLFNAEFTEREINAVHNEAMRHVQSDSRRVNRVRSELYAPGSGESKFSTGNSDTLGGTTPEEVRAFYEANYSSDRMALALAGRLPLDEMERIARKLFADVPRRDLPAQVRQPEFLPRREALRIAYVEPVKEWRQLSLEFVIPATRPHFLSKPDELVSALINYPGPGGLLDFLKSDGLVTQIGAGPWERAPEYGSFWISADLTPEGEADYGRVFSAIMSYLEHLRRSPFPQEFFEDRARIARLEEAYANRGEGAERATELANLALFYPLEVAERAPYLWTFPDESAYRQLLEALRADNMLATLAARGVPTNRQERIYGVAYSYEERSGPDFDALRQPPAVATFALPGANPFMPSRTELLAERPMLLIDQPGLKLYYSQDLEFQRPQTAIELRFRPVREAVSLEGALLLDLFSRGMQDALAPMFGDAELAGNSINASAGPEGLRLSVTGYGDAPLRVVAALGEQMRNFKLPPARFEALKEQLLRSLRSYEETESFQMAQDRRNALSREFQWLPNEQLPYAEGATWNQVLAYMQRFLSEGRLEALVHGHASADDSAAALRRFHQQIGAQPAAPERLVKQRHVALQAGEHVTDAASIRGVNASLIRDYLLPDDQARSRALALVANNFFSQAFYHELRTVQQLGYVVGAGSSGSQRERFLTFIIQSSTHQPAEIVARAEAFIAQIPDLFAELPPEVFATLLEGARSRFAERPTSIAEKAAELFEYAFTYDGEWDRRQAALQALDQLTQADVAAALRAWLGEQAKVRTVLLGTESLPLAPELTSTFSDRAAWKAGRQFR